MEVNKIHVKTKDRETISHSEILVFWRTSVDLDIKLLKERISKLEIRNAVTHEEIEIMDRQEDRFQKMLTSFGTGYKNESKWKSFRRRITSRRFALIQFFWLLICLVCFLYYGTTNFLRARANEMEEYKPKKLLYEIDYGEYGSNVQYDMPSVYIHFYVDFSNISYDGDLGKYENYWSEDLISDTLTQLLKSQNNFTESVTIIHWLHNYTTLSHEVDVEEAIVDYEKNWVYQDGLWAYFKLNLKSPAAGLGTWMTEVAVRCDLFNIDTSLPPIWGFNVYVEREFSVDQWSDAIFLDRGVEHSWHYYQIDIQERVTHNLDDTIVSTIENELVNDGYMDGYDLDGVDYMGDYDHGGNYSDSWGFVVGFKPGLVVEHWGEYVQYGIWDWVAAMGGVFSLISIIYFRVAYHIAVKSGGTSMGILPVMSFIYAIKEDILLLKDSLHEEEEMIVFK